MTDRHSFENPPVSTEAIPREQLERLLKLQRDLLEDAALSRDRKQILDRLCLAAESMADKAFASVMLIDEKKGTLTVQSAPSLPKDAIESLNGLKPGQGSCGNAVFHNEPMFVCDVTTDARWSDFGEFAKKYQIGACWSLPVVGRNGEPTGSFALTSTLQRAPSNYHRRLLDICAYIAGIVLQREEYEQELYRLGHYDSLTGLPNRVLFELRLQHAIQTATRRGGRLGLLFIDLDGFKAVNDSLGHEAGDRVLIEIGRRLNKEVRLADTVARISGDEFVVLLEDIEGSVQVGQVARKLLGRIAGNIALEGANFTITASLGVSLFPSDGRTPDALLRAADTAMFEAKSTGKNSYHYYEPALTERIQARFMEESALRAAVEHEQLEPYFQPQVDVVADRVVAVEVLLRWNHPARGLLEAKDFIKVADESGLIRDICPLVMRQALDHLGRLDAQGLAPFRVSLNVSARELDGGFSNCLQQSLESSGWPRERLEIEILEHVLTTGNPLRVKALTSLKKWGVNLAIDDFGVGESSLTRLKTLPVDKLKIDRSFITDLAESLQSRAIVRAIVELAKGLDLAVVVEGVESEVQSRLLRDLGCPVQQGYHVCKPLSASEFGAWLSKRR